MHRLSKRTRRTQRARTRRIKRRFFTRKRHGKVMRGKVMRGGYTSGFGEEDTRVMPGGSGCPHRVMSAKQAEELFEGGSTVDNDC